MRIVNRAEFLSTDGQVLFAKYTNGVIGPLQIKCDNSGSNDFVVQDISDAIKVSCSDEYMDLMDKAEDDSSVNMELDLECAGRDGLFDADQRFVIYDAADVRAIVARISECING